MKHFQSRVSRAKDFYERDHKFDDIKQAEINQPPTEKGISSPSLEGINKLR